jgi:hypothetical protein
LDGSVEPLSLEKAIAQQKKDKKQPTPSVAAAKSSLTGVGATVSGSNLSSSYVPPNSNFTANKSKDYTPPPRPVPAAVAAAANTSGVSTYSSVVFIPNHSNRKVRNHLSNEPMEYYHNDSIDESVLEESL